MRILTLGGRDHAFDVLCRVVDDLAVRGAHGFERAALAARDDLAGDLHREPLQRFLAALAVAGDIDPEPAGALGHRTVDDGAGQLLERGERLATGADEQTEIIAVDRDLDLVVVHRRRDFTIEAERPDEAVDELGGDLTLTLELCGIRHGTLLSGWALRRGLGASLGLRSRRALAGTLRGAARTIGRCAVPG